MIHGSKFIETYRRVLGNFGKGVTLHLSLSDSFIIKTFVAFAKHLTVYFRKSNLTKAITLSLRRGVVLNGLNIVSIIVLAATVTNIVLSIYAGAEIGFAGFSFRFYFLIASLAGIFGKADIKDIMATSFFVGVVKRVRRAL